MNGPSCVAKDRKIIVECQTKDEFYNAIFLTVLSKIFRVESHSKQWELSQSFKEWLDFQSEIHCKSLRKEKIRYNK